MLNLCGRECGSGEAGFVSFALVAGVVGMLGRSGLFDVGVGVGAHVGSEDSLEVD